MWQFKLINAIVSVIPFAKRKGRFLAWTRVFVSYISMLHDSFKVPYRIETIRDAYMTPQVCMLEKYLNDEFGFTSSIFISNGQELGPWLFYSNNPNIFYLDTQDSYIWSVNENPSFIVNIPHMNTETLIPKLIAIVNKYKLPGKSFIVNKYFE